MNKIKELMKERMKGWMNKIKLGMNPWSKEINESMNKDKE